MEALGRLIRNAAGRFVRHTPREETPPPSDSGSGSDGDPSEPSENNDGGGGSDSGDDPAGGIETALQSLRISLYNPLFHSGSDGRVIKGALRNPGGVKVEEVTPGGERVLAVYGRRTGGGFMGSGASTSPMYTFPRVGPPTPVQPPDCDLAHELRRVAVAPSSVVGVGFGFGNEIGNDSNDSSSNANSSPVTSPTKRAGVASLLRDRERGLARHHHADHASSQAESTRIANAAVGSCYIPNKNPACVDVLNSRAYCGRFSASGDLFAAAFQDRRVVVYDTRDDDDWRVRKTIHCRSLRWTVTDCSVSPDESKLFYSSITPYVHLVNVSLDDTNDECPDVRESVTNVTEVHESLEIGRGFEAPGLETDGVFGIWSCRWSGDGGKLLCGTSDAAACVHDVVADRTIVRHKAHDGDVNAVAWANGGCTGDARVYYTGSDDCTVKAWDVRVGVGAPIGVFIGHTEGVCHIDSRDDGRHLLSNGKDQTVRVWDLRRAWSNEDASAWCKRRPVPIWSWDYRFMTYPAHGWDFDMAKFSGTVSEDGAFRTKRALQTLRGHRVDQTLIRAYFSPAATTGGRYVYSGEFTL